MFVYYYIVCISNNGGDCGGDSLNAATRVPVNYSYAGGWSNSCCAVQFLD